MIVQYILYLQVITVHNDDDGLGSSEHTNTNADENVYMVRVQARRMYGKYMRLLIAVRILLPNHF